MRHIGLLLLLFSLGMTSSSPVVCNRGGPRPSDLDGSFWRLSSIGQGEDLWDVSEEVPVTLEFYFSEGYSRSSRLEGVIGCETYHASYQMSRIGSGEFQLELVGALAAPLGDCPAAERFGYEAEYRSILPKVRHGTLAEGGSGGLLTLGTYDG